MKIVLFAHALTSLIHSSSSAPLDTVKIEGPVTGYLFEDARECYDDRIVLGVTSGESISIRVFDEGDTVTFVDNLAIEPGMSVVPWKTNQNYAGRSSVHLL